MRYIKWILVGVAIVVLAGLAYYFFVFNRPDALVEGSRLDGEEGKPNAEIEKLHFTKFSPDETNLELSLNFFNPAPVGLRIDSMVYAVKMAGVIIAQSSSANALDIDALKRKSHTLKVVIDQKKMERAFEKAKARSDSTLYELDLAVYTNLPLMEGKPVRFERSKRLPAFKLPETELKKIKLLRPGLRSTEAALDVELRNHNSIPVGFRNGFYIIRLNEDTLGTGRIDSTVIVKPEASTRLEIPLKMKTSQALDALKSVLLQPGQTEYYYYFEADVVSKSPAMENAKTVTETKALLSQLKD